MFDMSRQLPWSQRVTNDNKTKVVQPVEIKFGTKYDNPDYKPNVVQGKMPVQNNTQKNFNKIPVKTQNKVPTQNTNKIPAQTQNKLSINTTNQITMQAQNKKPAQNTNKIQQQKPAPVQNLNKITAQSPYLKVENPKFYKDNFLTNQSYYIIPLNEMSEQLKKFGFCFVELPQNLQNSSSLAFNLSKKFFDSQWNNNNNSKYSEYFVAPQYGYQKTKYKQSFTILTGKMLEKQDNALEQLIPEQSIQQALKQNAIDFDNFAEQIMNNLPELTKTKNMGYQKDVPLSQKAERYGMIDIVQYKNQTDHKVIPHVDPGVISISVLSDLEGLQIFSHGQNEWIQAPVNLPSIGLVWTGLKAMELNPEFKGGLHQVLPKLGKLRTTMWYEIIAREQVQQEVQILGMLANKNNQLQQQQQEMQYYEQYQQQQYQQQQQQQYQQQQKQPYQHYFKQENNNNNLHYQNNYNNNNNYINNNNNNNYNKFNNNNSNHRNKANKNNNKKFVDYTQFIKKGGKNFPVTIYYDNTTFQLECDNQTTMSDLKNQMEEKSGMRYAKIAFRVNIKINGQQLVADNTRLVDLGLDQPNCPLKITMNKVRN